MMNMIQQRALEKLFKYFEIIATLNKTERNNDFLIK